MSLDNIGVDKTLELSIYSVVACHVGLIDNYFITNIFFAFLFLQNKKLTGTEARKLVRPNGKTKK